MKATFYVHRTLDPTCAMLALVDAQDPSDEYEPLYLGREDAWQLVTQLTAWLRSTEHVDKVTAEGGRRRSRTRT